MAQAGSVQREPSMEEILASIRRIIEDSDGTQGQTARAPEPPDEESADQAGDVEHFRAEFNEAPQRPENIVSELRPIDPPESRETEAGHEMLAPEGQETAAETPRSSVLDWPVNDWNSDAHDEEPEHSAAFFEESAKPNEPSRKDDSEEAREQTAEERRPAIISELAERKIAAAFEELNDAFEASRRQSLDEMAEEMLRPMLQDWLDNNLPLLVEKLVREEIERVARGGAR